MKETMMPLKDLAKLLDMLPSNLWRKVKKDKVETRKAPLLTKTGVRQVRWVPKGYALRLVNTYEEAKVNTGKEGQP